MTVLDLIGENYKPTNSLSLTTKMLEISFKKKNPNLFSFWVLGTQHYSSPTGHIVSILFDDKDGKVSTLLKMDVRVHCTCPAYTYWGCKFNATQRDYNYKWSTDIAPDKRDPKRERLICKHIASIRKNLRNMTLKRAHKKFKVESAEGTPTIRWDSHEVLMKMKSLYPEECITCDEDFERLLMRVFEE